MPVVPTDSNPFRWSEIHLLAKAKLEALDQTIRQEIKTRLEPLPANGGARHQFFVLLSERVDDWATRAKAAYLDCLTQIGRAPSQAINQSIWENGLKFFIVENLREYMILACGISPKELDWAENGSSGVRGTPQVKAVISSLHEIGRVRQSVLDRFRFSMSQSGDWLADSRKLLKSLPASEREDVIVTGRAPTSVITDRNPEQTQLHVSVQTDGAASAASEFAKQLQQAEPPNHREHIDFLRMPAGLRSSGDPVVGNPFHDDDQRHAVWADATRRAEQELHVFNAAGMGTLKDVQPRTEEEARRVLSAHQGHLTTGKFDIWAKRGVHVIWSEPDLQAFYDWLEQYANAWLNETRQFFPPELGNIDWLLQELRNRLIARIEYWKSEARRYLNAAPKSLEERIGEPALATEVQDYELAEDGRSVQVRGTPYRLTSGQAKMLPLLLEAYRSPNPEVPELKLKKVLGSEPRDTFRSCPLRKKKYLRVKNRRYFLVPPDSVEEENGGKPHQ